jgi:hypothetical protein
LQDGNITNAEANEIVASYEKCLTDLGFTQVSFKPDGEGQAKNPSGVSNSTANSEMANCDTNTDFHDVAWLYTQIYGNPQHVDNATIMAECLVRVGIRPSGYTAADYKREMSSSNGPPADMQPGTTGGNKLEACTVDPAHAS